MLKPDASVRPAILAGAALCLALASCEREAEPSAAPTPPPVEVAPPVAPPSPVLDRQGLLEGIARAASDHAAGVRADGVDPLVGRRFAVRLAFGCGGLPAGRDGLAQWAPTESGDGIRLSLTPEDWKDAPPVAGPGEEHWEAVEGFWISRPWMQGDACPAISAAKSAAAPETAAASPQTAGLAAVFETGGSRLSRRNGRAYAFTVRPPAGQAEAVVPEGGWQVVLEGRIVGFPDGRAVRCRSAGPDQRPVCVAAVKLDRVAFAAADGTTVLSEWRTG